MKLTKLHFSSPFCVGSEEFAGMPQKDSNERRAAQNPKEIEKSYYRNKKKQFYFMT